MKNGIKKVTKKEAFVPLTGGYPLVRVAIYASLPGVFSLVQMNQSFSGSLLVALTAAIAGLLPAMISTSA